MKRSLLKALIIFGAVSILCTGCNYRNGTAKNTEQSGSLKTETVGEKTGTEGRQFIEDAVDVKEKPEITEFTLSAICDGDINKLCKIYPSYPGHVMVSNTAGIIGAPIEITGSENLKEPTLRLCYNENELRGVPEKNIMALHYTEEVDDSDLIKSAEVDTENNTVTFDLTGDGYYLLVDIYEYGKVMQFDVSEYAYEKDVTAYKSDWEREVYTGDIMELADKEWAVENAPNFHVSTPQELASVVYYANAVADGESRLSIYFENDIDLSGYKWAPIGWKNFTNLFISIYGQNHTLSNLVIATHESDVGITGYVSSISVSDITVDNAYISGEGYVGIFSGQCNGDKNFTNVKASGEVYGRGNASGAFVGWGSGGSYVNCENNVKVNGENFPYYCSQDKIKALYSDETVYTLKMDEQGNISRSVLDNEYDNISWVITDENGKVVLNRNAANETVFPMDIIEKIDAGRGGKYTIHLEGWRDNDDGSSGYVKLSNTIEFTIQIQWIYE